MHAGLFTARLYYCRMPKHILCPLHNTALMAPNTARCGLTEMLCVRHKLQKPARGGGGSRETDLAHEGLMGVAELAQVQQRLHHRLLQRLLCLFLCVFMPVDVPAGARLQNRLHSTTPLLNILRLRNFRLQLQELCT